MPECDILDYLRFGATPFLQGPLLPDLSLLSTPAWIQNISRASYIVLEFRLGEEDNTVDLCWGCEPQRFRAPPGTREEPWPALERFSEAWIGDEELLKDISTVVFEADDCGLAAPPAMFFTVEELARRRYPELVRRLSEIFALPFSAAAEETVRRSIDSASREPTPYIGLMISRERAPIRIGARVGGPSEVLAYLQAIGWPGPYEPFSTFLRDMSRRFGHLVPYLAFDALDDGVQPRLGLEYFFAEPNPGPQSQAAAVLDHLVDLGLCSRGKREALLAWPGVAVDPRASRSDSWASRFIDAGSLNVFRRILAHVKIVFEPDRTIAKAYLECRHLRIRTVEAA